MKKRIIVCLLVILSLFLVVGCKDTTKKETKKSNKKEVVQEIETKVNDYSILINTAASFNGMNYKYPSTAVYSNVGTYSIIDYMDGENLVVRTAMYYYENQYDYEVMKSSNAHEIGSMVVNGREWKRYESTEYNKKVFTVSY